MQEAAPRPGGRVIVITGAMAAGKSTVAEALARRLPAAVHVRGDAFRRMVVTGRADMTPEPSQEATAQLALRYELAAHTADRFAAHGFDAVVQDVVLGPELRTFVARLRTPERFLVVLAPSATALEDREQGRDKVGYTGFTPAQLDAVLRDQTPRIGYWLDSSGQTAAETVEDVLANLGRARL